MNHSTPSTVTPILKTCKGSKSLWHFLRVTGPRKEDPDLDLSHDLNPIQSCSSGNPRCWEICEKRLPRPVPTRKPKKGSGALGGLDKILPTW